ncbi:hypothetical protein [Nodosilinea nodulosa]|uniref:hypothetical protein n=1 Tax=Nodosilinea nodulosa TaxID=416001 RepID=UPI0012D8279D|nr:hypothetical protein [Nodosilinea nodulosa]
MTQVNLDNVLNIACLGIRRAIIFMGLGLNAATDPNFKDYSLIPHTGISLVPNAASDEVIEEYKREFSSWIVAGGLREIIESFSVFLDEVYTFCLQTSISNDTLTLEDAQNKNKCFKQVFLNKKLKLLSKDYPIDSEINQLLLDLGRVRNCLTHRRGIVSNEDCNTEHGLQVSWKALEIVAKQQTGAETPIPFPIKEPVFLAQGGTLNAQWYIKSAVFPVGTSIRLKPRDLSEIAFLVNEEAKKIISSVILIARSAGADITEH